MDYGQLFAQVLQRPSAEDTMSQAQRLAQAISTYQTAQRTKPVIEAIQRYGRQYSTAQDDASRQAANAMANTIRANYLQGGGSPADLPSQYWGSDPTQGFQTSEGFQAPITGYEGLSRKEAMEARRQALMDALTQKQWAASPESQEWYLPLYKQNLEAGIANTLRSANAPYGGSGGGGGGTTKKNAGDAGSDAYDMLRKFKEQGGSAYDAMDIFYKNRKEFEGNGITETKYKNMVNHRWSEEAENTSSNAEQYPNGKFTIPSFGAGALFNKMLGR